MKSTQLAVVVGLAVSAAAPVASAGPTSWAASEIQRVTSVGVLASSPADFRPQAPLTERALAAAISATDKLLNPPAPPAAAPVLAPAPVAAPVSAPAAVLSSIPDGATIAASVAWVVTVPGQIIDHVAFAIDGVQQDVEPHAPFAFLASAGGLVTTNLSDGLHQLAVAAVSTDGGTYVAVWSVTVANAPGAALTPLPTAPVPVPVTKAPPPPAAPQPVTAPVPAPVAQPRPLYKALSPAQPVTVKELDAALVGYLGLAAAAREIQQKLRAAGLRPRAGTGSEVVARLLGLRLNHPAGQDNLELLPFQSATRAEAAYSFAQVLRQGDWVTQWAQELADGLTLPSFTPWQRRILATAVGYIGYPYVWGGTSPTTEAPFGDKAPGGFDCSGFIWRIYKLTSYPGEHGLAGVLRGRTTYQMSGEVPHSELLAAGKLQPGDVMFFGVGPDSKPSQVGHAGIYTGSGWFIQSSDEGVTLVPFDDWHKRGFAWARRPLHEAGLA